MPYLQPISCSLVAIGLGWTFAEVRRFFIHPADFALEALDDYRRGHTISLISGLLFLFIGALAVFYAFDLGVPTLASKFPYIADSPEGRRFLKVCGIGLGGWGLFSLVSVRLFPPPLFSDSVTAFLCRIVRGGLFLVWGAAMAFSARHIGDRWPADALGLLFALLALAAIHSGQVWTGWRFGWWEPPPVTCADRPFPYTAAVLLLTAASALLCLAT